MNPTPEDAFHSAKRVFESMRRLAGGESRLSPIQEVIAPSIAMALTRQAQALPRDQQLAINRLVGIVTPAFRLSHQMFVHASFYHGPPEEISFVVRGHVGDLHRRFNPKIVPFRHPDFQAPIADDQGQRYDTLWEISGQIGFRMLLQQGSASMTARTRNELLPNGQFCYSATETVAPHDPNTAAGVAECILGAVAASLRHL